MKHASSTITVYNKHYDAGTGYDKYFPTVIRGVSWHGSNISAATGSGLASANQFTIRIPASTPEKSFVGVKEFQTVENPSAFFTLTEGDIIVLGDAVEDYETPAEIEQENENVVQPLF